jgi:transcriptional regulator with XRE-family HTH domain
MTSLTSDASRDLGRSLRFIRHAKNLTLREVAKVAGLSAQYVQNIERGERGSASEDAYDRLARGYGIDPTIVADLVLKARVMSALELRGLDAEPRAFVWRGVEPRLAEVGLNLRTNVEKLVADIIGS